MDRTVTELAQTFSLEGRTAVITGAASGLGREIACVLALAGANTVLADVNRTGLTETAEMVRASGHAAHTQETDVSVSSELDALGDAAIAAFSRIDIWVNVAGTVILSPILDTDPKAAERLLAVNALGVQHGCAAAGRLMKERGGGAIVNISSAGGVLPVPGMSTYCMSKAAVNQLTRVCALEFGPFNIRVNAVAPGWIETPMGSAVFRDAKGEIDPEARERYLAEQRAQSPIGITGTPADIAYAVLYLVSDASRFVTGQVLTVNGGVSM